MNRFRIACALGVLAFAAPLHAQSPWSVSFGATGAREIVQSRVGSARTRLTGSLFGGELVVTRRRFVARLRYGQGQVASDTAERDLVHGEALVGYQARPWLHVWLGPRGRTFVATGLSDRRWLFWSGGLSARGAIFPGRLESFAEFWHSFSGTLNRPASAASGRGSELGLEARLAQRPFWLRLAYRIEQGRVDDGRRDTVEGFTLTAGYSPAK